MRWNKKGLIFSSKNNFEWMVSHAQLPVPYVIDRETLRIYFGTRDLKNRVVTTYIEVDANDFQKVKYIHDKPVIGLGKPGDFDHAGAMPSCIVKYQDSLYFYYVAWSLSDQTVPYRLSIGLAVSRDQGKTFEKFGSKPILGLSKNDPYFVASPFVLLNEELWQMWYISCTKWEEFSKRLEPFYTVKYAESKDGIHWKPSSKFCLQFDDFAQAFARPYVVIEEGRYHMFYSYRHGHDFRKNPEKSYRLGYAQSSNGYDWQRFDDQVGIEKSKQGWDCEMIEYGAILKHQGKTHLFYNGNGFGASGVGYATLEGKLSATL